MIQEDEGRIKPAEGQGGSFTFPILIQTYRYLLPSHSSLSKSSTRKARFGIQTPSDIDNDQRPSTMCYFKQLLCAQCGTVITTIPLGQCPSYFANWANNPNCRPIVTRIIDGTCGCQSQNRARSLLDPHAPLPRHPMDSPLSWRK